MRVLNKLVKKGHPPVEIRTLGEDNEQYGFYVNGLLVHAFDPYDIPARKFYIEYASQQLCRDGYQSLPHQKSKIINPN